MRRKWEIRLKSHDTEMGREPAFEKFERKAANP
jgi:hypothetical protein